MSPSRTRRKRNWAFGALVLLAGCVAPATSETSAVAPAALSHAAVAWEDWESSAFERASDEHRILLINVVATWCHWCHVMEEETYADPEVAALLANHFVTIRVDSDARPDVGERYRAWGWPATAILSPGAQPVTELRGYQDPRKFAALLRSLVAERDAGPMVRRSPVHPTAKPTDVDLEQLRDDVALQLDGYYEPTQGGWGQQQKYPFAAPVEHAFFRAQVRDDGATGGESQWRARAEKTLKGTRRLIDPVWGGVYQYSLEGDWDHPHYEKITAIQAGAIESLSIAARVTRDPAWLGSADAVRGYMNAFMRDAGGGYYTSQDADLRIPGALAVEGRDYYAMDDAQRRARGVPRIDTNIYADLNGLMIAALAQQFAASGDREVLADAVGAAQSVLGSHRIPGGGFVHGASDDRAGLLYLRDQASMGAGLLALYRVTSDARWLAEAKTTADFMLASMADPSAGGFWAHTADPTAVGVFAERRKPVEENGLAARLLLGLHRYSDGDGSETTPYLGPAFGALKSVGERAGVRREGRIVGTYLLGIEEALMRTIDVTVVGADDDATADALHAATLQFADPRVIVERSHPGERYPDIGKAAAYLCTDSACSSPVTRPEAFESTARAFINSIFRG